MLFCNKGSVYMKISTSILNAKNKIESIVKLNTTNTDYIHVDVMDGKFVKDTQFNKINEISSLNIISKYPLDIHLMVENPIKYIEQLQDMNIEYITFHIEVEKNINKIISLIKELNYKVGIAINPNTDINKVKPYLDKIDMILIMSVEPGRSGHGADYDRKSWLWRSEVHQFPAGENPHAVPYHQGYGLYL